MATGAATLRIDLRALEAGALAATRAAALACLPWVGRGSAADADGAATEAMRTVLSSLRGLGTVVVGEGAKDEAPMLYSGERLGRGDGPAFDIAVDPLECTKLCARGLPGALATIAFAEPGAMASLATSFYMEKLVGPPPTRGLLDITAPAETNCELAAAALGKRLDELRVFVLDKPRHAELIARLHRAGVAVLAPSDGDIAGGLAALLPDGEADLLMGVGGTPEGVMTACAAGALGGHMQARLAPQRSDEAAAIDASGLSPYTVWEIEDLVAGDSLFVATGVTGGALLPAPHADGGRTFTEALVIAHGNAERKCT